MAIEESPRAGDNPNPLRTTQFPCLRSCFGVLRGRFSPSPATGLIGLQENEFLGDFFDCLGFLSITSER